MSKRSSDFPSLGEPSQISSVDNFDRDSKSEYPFAPSSFSDLGITRRPTHFGTLSSTGMRARSRQDRTRQRGGREFLAPLAHHRAPTVLADDSARAPGVALGMTSPFPEAQDSGVIAQPSIDLAAAFAPSPPALAGTPLPAAFSHSSRDVSVYRVPSSVVGYNALIDAQPAKLRSASQEGRVSVGQTRTDGPTLRGSKSHKPLRPIRAQRRASTIISSGVSSEVVGARDMCWAATSSVRVPLCSPTPAVSPASGTPRLPRGTQLEQLRRAVTEGQGSRASSSGEIPVVAASEIDRPEGSLRKRLVSASSPPYSDTTDTSSPYSGTSCSPSGETVLPKRVSPRIQARAQSCVPAPLGAVPSSGVKPDELNPVELPQSIIDSLAQGVGRLPRCGISASTEPASTGLPRHTTFYRPARAPSASTVGVLPAFPDIGSGGSVEISSGAATPSESKVREPIRLAQAAAACVLPKIGTSPVVINAASVSAIEVSSEPASEPVSKRDAEVEHDSASVIAQEGEGASVSSLSRASSADLKCR